MSAKLIFALAGAAGVILGASAEAATIDLASTGQGYINQTGSSNGSGVGNSYLAGNCGLGDCYAGEFRNFFNFDVSGLGAITSAKLILDTGFVNQQQSGGVTYTATSTASQAFADLGTGTVFGSRTYTVADDAMTETINLNASALAAIETGGTFEVSGRVTSPTNFGPNTPDQLIFGATNGRGATLELTTGAIPEPTTWALMLIGSAGLGASLRRSRRVRAASSI